MKMIICNNLELIKIQNNYSIGNKILKAIQKTLKRKIVHKIINQDYCKIENDRKLSFEIYHLLINKLRNKHL